MAMVNPNAQAYAQNLQLQAEIQCIREEMQRQAKQAQIAQEVQNRLIAANTNPRTKIIRDENCRQSFNLLLRLLRHHPDIMI